MSEIRTVIRRPRSRTQTNPPDDHHRGRDCVRCWNRFLRSDALRKNIRSIFRKSTAPRPRSTGSRALNPRALHQARASITPSMMSRGLLSSSGRVPQSKVHESACLLLSQLTADRTSRKGRKTQVPIAVARGCMRRGHTMSRPGPSPPGRRNSRRLAFFRPFFLSLPFFFFPAPSVCSLEVFSGTCHAAAISAPRWSEPTYPAEMKPLICPS